MLYGREADSVILTPDSSDHGVDVVVQGWGSAKSNLLIQCTATTNDELNSEEAVRAVSATQPFLEKLLGVSFTHRIVHTTAKKFGKACLNTAKLYSVGLYGRDWLKSSLSRLKPTRSEIIQKDAERKQI